MTITTWSYVSGEEGWTGNDDSTGDASATLTHSVPAAALRANMTVTGAGSQTVMAIESDTLNIPIQSGDSVAWDFSGSSVQVGKTLVVFYTDATNEFNTVSGTIPGTLTVNLTSTKTIDFIRTQFDRLIGGGSDTFTIDSDEVRLTTALSPGVRPLGIDVDVDGGTKIWETVWGANTLFLREYSTALAIQIVASFGTATEAQVDARTFYLSPYAPPFFGTAGLDDIIYVYGRWDDSSVTHLEKSTDGGSSFTDIGDSATWGAGWVGAFFATDSSNLFAFVNGAARALYRSTDGGSNWTSLSSLPFDVDPGAVSLHADGRLLISNRVAAAQMVAYAESPDFSSWINATDAFPTGGSGSPAIIWVT